MSYEKLIERFSTIFQLREVLSIAEWDQSVNMPREAGPLRAQALAALVRVTHDAMSDPRLTDLLWEAERREDLSPFDQANLAEMKRAHQRAIAVPASLVEHSSRSEKNSEHAWRTFRKENDFASYAPYLDAVVSAKREVAQALAEALNTTPYEALVDEYEPGLSMASIDAAFEPLKQFLPSFTDAVIDRQKSDRVIYPKGPFSVEAQRNLGLELMAATGVEMNRCRLDVSAHPFCGGVPRDVRITTRYSEAEFFSGLLGVLHEAGHAKYEQNLPPEWLHQPVGQGRGMVLHESQSLLQEMQVCRGRPFFQFLSQKVASAFPEQAATTPDAFSPDNLFRLGTRVEKGFIRVNADEVTYPAHVLLRYDLERALIGGTLAVKDLPEAWDAGMRGLLGLSTLGNDRDGCMQDIHWPLGAFGYFPLYTLGALAAAQLFTAARARVLGLDTSLAQGDFTTLNEWLKQHVWSIGRSKSTEEILLEATGQTLSAKPFISHLKARYAGEGGGS